MSCPKGYEELCRRYETGTRYKITPDGTYRVKINLDGETTRTRLCSSPLYIVERYVNIDDGTEKCVIAFINRGAWRLRAVERETLSTASKITKLAGFGLDITSTTARQIVDYFQEVLRLNAGSIAAVRTSDRLGWHGREFIPFSDRIKCDAADNFRDIARQLTTKGDFELWRSTMVKLRENIYFRLITTASFAAPLVELVGGLPFVVHLWGGTGTGKTVALCAAASVWGRGAYANNSLVQSFKATGYALEEKAAFLYSLPMLIDEGQTYRSEEFNSLIMNLTEGKGKSQGAAAGGIRKLRHWNGCFITTAEENLIKQNSGGGTANRVISIEAKEKVVEDGHAAMQVIGNNYGFAGRMFTDYLRSVPEGGIEQAHSMLYKALRDNASSTEKLCLSAATLLTADVMAEDSVFKSGTKLTVADIRPFLTDNAEVDNAARAYEWLVNWVAQNVSRFRTDATDTIETWGRYINGDTAAVINKNVVIEHLHRAGFDYGAVMPALAQRGKLILTKQGKWVSSERINGAKASCIRLVIDEDVPW